MVGQLRVLLCLISLCCALAAQGQQIARIQLRDGRVVEGIVVSLEQDRIVLRPDSGPELELASDEIDRMLALGRAGERMRPLARRREPRPPGLFDRSRRAPPAPGGETVAPEPATATKPEPKPARLAETADPGPPSPPNENLLEGLFAAYLWFVPNTWLARLSTAVASFVSLSLVLLLCARMANVSNPTFGKASTLALFVAAASIAQLAFAGHDVVLLSALSVIDLGLWFLLVRKVFQAPLLETVGMLVCFVMIVLVIALTLSSFGLVMQTTF